jgi:hypothetical protein
MPKNCSGTRGYSCGKSCISVKKICRKDKLSGQSVKLLDRLSKRSEDLEFKQLSESETEKLHFAGYDATKSQLQNITDYGVKDPELSLEAVQSYTRGDSKAMKKVEARIDLDVKYFNTDDLKEKVAGMNDFIEKAPKYAGPIMSGFAKDMEEIYGTDKLEVGAKFSFPSMTSFSSNKDIASSFNGGGYFIINNNKSGASIKPFSSFDGEDEIVVSKSAKYRVASIDKISNTYFLEEI